MVKGFKCAGCDEFSTEAEIIRIHEATCPYIPTNKACDTCKHHHVLMGHYMGVLETLCRKHHDAEHMEAVKDAETRCSNWEEGANTWG